ncbi:MAG: hypothetical protein HOE14_04735 [Gemmatimonadales bacterium]|nr:hypothetical protein [Gemmatimonadales bacterium]
MSDKGPTSLPPAKSARPAPPHTADKGGGDRGKPMPVRQAAQDAHERPPESDVAELSLIVEGIEWPVRATGRSGGAAVGAAPLILLLFSSAKVEGVEAVQEREAMVVGQHLSDFSEDRLLSAFSESRPPLSDKRPRKFFSDGRARAGKNPRRGS